MCPLQGHSGRWLHWEVGCTPQVLVGCRVFPTALRKRENTVLSVSYLRAQMHPRPRPGPRYFGQGRPDKGPLFSEECLTVWEFAARSEGLNEG